MSNLELVKLEHIFKILGNRKRLALLVYLFSGEVSISVISTALDIPYKTAERNLINLQEAGFVSKRTENNKTYFSINNSARIQYAHLLKMIRNACQKGDVIAIAKSLLETAREIEKIHSTIRSQWLPL